MANGILLRRSRRTGTPSNKADNQAAMVGAMDSSRGKDRATSEFSFDFLGQIWCCRYPERKGEKRTGSHTWIRPQTEVDGPLWGR
jgi:hypothetical protein